MMTASGSAARTAVSKASGVSGRRQITVVCPAVVAAVTGPDCAAIGDQGRRVGRAPSVSRTADRCLAGGVQPGVAVEADAGGVGTALGGLAEHAREQATQLRVQRVVAQVQPGDTAHQRSSISREVRFLDSSRCFP